MSKKPEKDKLLLENLDRIVSGEQLKDESELDKDTRAALELSREMTSWSKSPSKEFKSQLKARITHQLAQQNKQEAIESGGSEFWDLLHRHRWQFTIAAVIAAIIVAIITLIVLWINKTP
jgi:anti-sigma-K factor RskA